MRRIFRPIDASSIVYFRISFGLIMLWEVWRYFSRGWIGSYYADKDFYFTYPFFHFVHPWPSEELMKLHFLIMGILAVCIALGFLYRISATLFFFAFTYVFLLEQARYLNHFYMVALVAFLMIFIPAHQSFSVDGFLRSRFPRYPFLQLVPSSFVPSWSLWILRFQIGVVYFFGGIAKLNYDWLTGHPLVHWIADESHLPIIGPYVQEYWMALLLSYSGLLIDLFIVPLLFFKKTRWFGFAVAVAFNLMNAQLFKIGIFPWFMIAGTLLFFEPDWPRRLWDFCTLKKSDQTLAQKERDRAVISTGLSSCTLSQKYLAVLLAVFIAVQILIPFRHWLYPSNVHFSEEGHRFSWHMKLRSKSADVSFIAKNSVTGETWEIDSREYLNRRQIRKMAARPEMILLFAHRLRDIYAEQGIANVEIYAESFASLNGRPMQRMIDPDVNLAKVEWSLKSSKWILPLEEI